MWKPITLGVASLVMIALGVVLIQPSDYVVERSTTIRAPIDNVYAHIADLHAMEEWSPFFKMDPNQKATYSGAPQGIGAVYEWEGETSGKGRMTIEDVAPPSEVDVALELLEPMASKARALLTLRQPRDQLTEVTWRIEGKNDFMGKAVSLLMDMDQMIGGEFEKGLASLKTVCEKDSGATEARSE